MGLGLEDTSKKDIVFGLIAFAVSFILLITIYRFIGTFVFGLFVYYASRPIYHRVLNRVNHPNIAASITLFLFAFPFLFLLGYTILIAVTEFSTIISTINGTGIGSLLGNVEFTRMSNQPQKLVEFASETNSIRDLFEVAIAYLAILADILLKTFLVFIFAFYMLRDGHKLKAKLYRSLPRSPELITFIEDTDRDFQTLFFGNILHAILTAVIASVIYTLLGTLSPPGITVPYPVLLGALTGVTSLIPVIGSKIVYVPASGALLAASISTHPDTYWFPVLFFAVSILIIDSIPDYLIRPYVSGDRLHMGSLIFAYVVGPIMFGWYGLFYGPMLLILVTNFFGAIFPVLFEPTYALPGSTDPGAKPPAADDIKELPPGDGPNE